MQIKHYIQGEFDNQGEAYAGINPATGEEFYQALQGNDNVVDAAVSAACAARDTYARTLPEQRATWLWQLADLLAANQQRFAELESQDAGKPITQVRDIEIPRAIANLRFFATLAMQTSSQAFNTSAQLNYVLREPLGVVACIAPWNLPLYLLTWKIAPALALGNTVVAKPSEVTPLTAYHLAELIEQSDLPRGVCNIIFGDGSVGARLCEHRDVNAITFTGGTKAGGAIAKSAAPQFKKTCLELGGKNAAIVCADAKLDKAVDGCLRSAFTNQGQVCLATSRIFVHESRYEEFLSRFIDGLASWQPQNPALESIRCGALVSQAHYQQVLAAIERAKTDGGHCVMGGKSIELASPCHHGYFIEPTVLTDVTNQAWINQHEVFGPVVCIMPFSELDEVVEQANDSPYGLCASIWTEHLQSAHYLAQALQVGIVWLNTWLARDLRTPFGGMKQSGLGREGGQAAIDFFTQVKNVGMSMEYA